MTSCKIKYGMPSLQRISATPAQQLLPVSCSAPLAGQGSHFAGFVHCALAPCSACEHLGLPIMPACQSSQQCQPAKLQAKALAWHWMGMQTVRMLSRLKEGLQDIMGELDGEVRPVWGHPQRIQAWQALVNAARRPQVCVRPVSVCTVMHSSDTALA